jgi:hypothetical protein
MGSRIKSQLRFGLWPEAHASAHEPIELTIAARKSAETALAEFSRLGVNVAIGTNGRARFRSIRIPPPKARLMIEIHGDAIEAFLKEQRGNESGLPINPVISVFHRSLQGINGIRGPSAAAVTWRNEKAAPSDGGGRGSKSRTREKPTASTPIQENDFDLPA